MRTKILVPTILLFAAALLSACSGSFQIGQAMPRTINVTGNSEVILTPDIAYVSVGVHSEAENAKAAVADNNAKSQAVIDAIKSQGVDEKDIKTTNFSVYQQQKFSPTGEDLGIIFAADNTVYVTMRAIDKIGEILDTSINAGANSIYGITFDVQDKDAALSTGRDEAIADAKAQAEQLASATGSKLGDVQNISYYSSMPPVPYYYDNKAMGGAGMEAASIPITPGQLTLTVSVNLTYSIK